MFAFQAVKRKRLENAGGRQKDVDDVGEMSLFEIVKSGKSSLQVLLLLYYYIKQLFS